MSPSVPPTAGTGVNTPFGATLRRFIESKRVQVLAYKGDRPVETAKSGILRVGSHSKYGFGELRVIRL